MSNSHSNRDIPVLTALTEEQVADYLRRHPDFLVDKPALLADMNLPHQTDGKAVSLIERQVSILRDRNMDMRHRLTKLLDNARTNDTLFEKTKVLLLNLLDAQDWDGLLDGLLVHLQQEFQIQYSQLLLIGAEGDWPQSGNNHTRITTTAEAQPVLGDLLQRPRALCGQLKPEQLNYLFGDQAEAIGSIALAPLRYQNRLLGFLVIGNSRPDYYRSSMNTLFLSFIADVLSRMLPHHYRNPNPGTRL